MADRSGPDLTSPDKIFLLNKDGRNNTKKKRMNELMEFLRSRSKAGASGRSRTWNEAAKVLRMSMTDKKHQIEASEKQQISKHLSVLQCAFKVSSQRSMLERLESLCQDLALTFTKGGVSGGVAGEHVYISCADLFYLELLVDGKGGVMDGKIGHGGEPTLCMEIVKLLNESKFEEFREHLQGILAIYNITADKKLKTKTFTALQSLETDLNNLSKLQCTITSVPNFIHKSPLGILIPRVGGTPMKLVYFVGPYDLLDKKTKTSKPMTIEGITENDLGHSVTVTLEPCSDPQKLQTMSLMTVNKTSDGKSLPSFAPVNNMNSSVLNAIFVLKLHRKMAMSCAVLHAIQKTTEVEFEKSLSVKSFVDVLVEQMIGEKADSVIATEGLDVNLPDQSHRFFLSCAHGCDMQRGALVDRIPFLHPTSVPTVIKYLRQQALFNTVLGSCVRRASQGHDYGHQLTFDITPLNLQTISVSFEHPFTDAIATADLDLSDITSLRCHISSTHTDQCTGEMTSQQTNGRDTSEICSDDTATRIFQRCLSLPITLRSVFRECYDRMDQHLAHQIPSPVPPPLSEPKPLFCLQTLQHNNSFPISRKGKERRAAFLNAAVNHRDRHKIVNSFLGANSVGGSPASLLPGVTQASMTATTSTTTVSVPPPKYHQAAATATTAVHKAALLSSSKQTSNSSNSREVTVISPEVISAYETGLMDPNQASKETLEYIKKDKIIKNPMLASLLDEKRDSPENVVSQSSMLSALLVSNASHQSTPNTTQNSQNSSVSPTDMPVPKQAVAMTTGAHNAMHQQHQMLGIQQHQHMKAFQQKPRKRKSTGDNKSVHNSGGMVGGGNMNAFNALQSMSNANNALGRSPKRLLSEEDHSLQFTTFSPISSAENDNPSHHHHQPSPLGLHHPPGGTLGPTPNGPSHVLDSFGHPLGQHPQQQQPHLANFHSQTRVGGVDFPPHSVVSSSVAMVTESNQSPHSISSTSPTSGLVANQSAQSSSNISTSVSSHGNVVESPSAQGPLPPNSHQQSPIFCLSNSLDSLLKSQQKSSATPSTLVSSSVASIKEEKLSNTLRYNELLTLLNDGESGSKRPHTMDRQRDTDTSSSIAVVKSEAGHTGNPHGDVQITHASHEIKTEDKLDNTISLSMECESIDATPAKDRTLALMEYKKSISISGAGSAKESKRPRSVESDPFEFPDVTLDNSCSMDSDADLSDGSLEYEEEASSTASLTPPKYTKSANTSKERLNHMEYHPYTTECYNKKERKKSRPLINTSHVTREYSVEESKKGTLGITMKINAKDGSAKAFVKQSPLHQSSQEYELIGSSKKWKESRSRYSVGLSGDRMSDSSLDGEVFVTMTSEGSKHHLAGGSNSGGNVYNSQNASTAPRILTSKKHGLDSSYGGSSSSVSFVTKDKKKKSSKLSSESKQEKKRKRAAEAREKDQLKKQKVYDFDFNESEHLPPTKIKIRTSDGKVQIQTDSMKTYSMSPLPMKPDPNSGRDGKRHKSEKSVKHKKDKADKYNRSKSENQGKADKNDSKLYNKRPVVKIKPLENTPPTSTISSVHPVTIATDAVHNHTNHSPLSTSVIKTSPLVTSPTGLESGLLSSQKSVKGSSVNSRDSVSSVRDTTTSMTADVGVRETSSPVVALKPGKESSSVANQVISKSASVVVTSLKMSKDGSPVFSVSNKSSKDTNASVTVKSSKELTSSVTSATVKSSKELTSSVTSATVKSSKELTSSTATSMVVKSSTSKPSTATLTNSVIKSSKEDSSSVLSDKVKVTSSGSSLNSSSSSVSNSSADQVRVKQVTGSTASESTKNGQVVSIDSSSKPKTDPERKRASVSTVVARGSPVLPSGGSNNVGERARSLSEKSGISSEKLKIKVNNSLDKDGVAKIKSDKVTTGNDLQSKVSKVAAKDGEGKGVKDKTTGIKETEGQMKVKEKTLTAKEGEGQVKVKNKVQSVKEGESQSVKGKTDKSGGDPQKKQRKGSLTAVIDKLKKGFTETEHKPKKTQNMYDAIRHEILKAGDNKSSMLPIAKIGKKSKHETTSQAAAAQVATSKPASTSSSKPGSTSSNNKPVSSSKPVSTSSNKPVSSGSGQLGAATGPKTGASVSNPSKSTNSPSQNPKVVSGQKTPAPIHKGPNSVLDGILPKRAPSTSFRIPKTDTSKTFNAKSEDHTTKSPSVQSGSSVVNVSSQAKSGYGQTGITPVNHVVSKNPAAQLTGQLNRQNSKDPDKSKKLKVDDISEKLQGRHFLDAVDSITKEEQQAGEKKGTVNSGQVQKVTIKSATRTESNPKDPRTWNSHFNNTVNDGMPRSKSPVITNKFDKTVVNNTSPSLSSHGNSNNKLGSSSNSSHNSSNPRANSQMYVSSQKVSKTARATTIDNKKHVNNLLDQPKIIPINKRDPRVSSKEGSASPQPSHNSSEMGGSMGASAPLIAYYNPAEALGRKTSSSETVAKQPTSKDTGVNARSSKATVVSESPASPIEKPGLTIRHDTPPASPIHAHVSDNKENLAKSIPLDEDKGRFKAPTPPKPELAKPVASHSGFDKPKVGISDLKSKLGSSDPSSPEDCVITEVATAKSQVSKAPVTIPLERSRSKSPNDRARSPLTPRSPMAMQPPPKDRTVSPALSKTPDSPVCKGLKGGVEEVGNEASINHVGKVYNQVEEDDLMNDALML